MQPNDTRCLIVERSVSELEKQFPSSSRWTALRRAASIAPRPIGKILTWTHKSLTSSDVPVGVATDRGVILMHRGIGAVFHPQASIAAPAIVFHGVTIGNNWSRVDGVPELRPFVFVGAGATILGPITIGAFSTIAAGAVVASSVPALSVVRGNPAIIEAADRASSRRWFRLTDAEMDLVLATEPAFDTP